MNNTFIANIHISNILHKANSETPVTIRTIFFRNFGFLDVSPTSSNLRPASYLLLEKEVGPVCM